MFSVDIVSHSLGIGYQQAQICVGLTAALCKVGDMFCCQEMDPRCTMHVAVLDMNPFNLLPSNRIAMSVGTAV